MRRDRRQEIVQAAVAAVGAQNPGLAAGPLTPGPSPIATLRVAGRGENGTATGAVGGESIQAEDGTLYVMCGVSACGGSDVVAP